MDLEKLTDSQVKARVASLELELKSLQVSPFAKPLQIKTVQTKLHNLKQELLKRSAVKKGIVAKSIEIATTPAAKFQTDEPKVSFQPSTTATVKVEPSPIRTVNSTATPKIEIPSSAAPLTIPSFEAEKPVFKPEDDDPFDYYTTSETVTPQPSTMGQVVGFLEENWMLVGLGVAASVFFFQPKKKSRSNPKRRKATKRKRRSNKRRRGNFRH